MASARMTDGGAPPNGDAPVPAESSGESWQDESLAVALKSGSEKASLAQQDPPAILASSDATWQWYFSPSDMDETPSVLYSGLTVEQERYNRWKGVQLLFRIGDYMRLGNHVTCTAAMYMHRFYMRRPMPKEAREKGHDTFTFQEIAPTCIFLACKVEETHRKLHSIIEATMAVLDRSPVGVQRAEAHMYRADVNSREYQRWKDLVLLHEERLLETLCFDLIIEQPHPFAIKGCQRIGVSRDLAQLTILIINTLLYGAVCCYYDAATLAACAFKKACQYTGKDANDLLQNTHYADRVWNDAFDVDQDEIVGECQGGAWDCSIPNRQSTDALHAVDDQLLYHQERLAPPPSAVQSSASTPLPAQHTSLARPASQLIDRDIPTDGKRPSHLGSAPAQDSAGSNIGDQGVVTDPTGTADTSMELEEQRRVQHESRTDSFRPVSRHGSKVGLFGPPPPLSSGTPASHDERPVSYTMASPKVRGQESGREDGREDKSDPHVAAVVRKVTREQAHQEAREDSSSSVPAKTTGNGDEESEEEGAL